jgi:hypothetical protein
VDIQALFGLSVLISFVAFGLVPKLYIWSRLRILERDDALIPLVLPHTFRFIGLSVLVPEVVSTSLPAAFAAPVAYGDLAAVKVWRPTRVPTGHGGRDPRTSEER